MAATATPKLAPERHPRVNGHRPLPASPEPREYPITRCATASMAIVGGVVLLLGAISDLVSPIDGFNLGSNLTKGLNLPAAVALLLLLTAAGLALLRTRVAAGYERACWIGLAGLFAYMSVDEAVGLNRGLESAFGIDWLLLHAPIVIGAGVLWALVLRGFGSDATCRRLWIGGAALWGLSQLFELVTLGRISLEVPLTVPEEAFEMVGSALFALAILRYLESGSPPWVIRVRDAEPGLPADGAPLLTVPPALSEPIASRTG